jgi:hypothetical protein
MLAAVDGGFLGRADGVPCISLLMAIAVLGGTLCGEKSVCPSGADSQGLYRRQTTKLA